MLRLCLAIAVSMARANELTLEQLSSLGADLVAGRLDASGLKTLRRHAELHPNDYRALAMAGQALTAQSSTVQLEEAIDYLERARSLAPSTAEVIMAHAAALLKMARLADADADAFQEAAAAYRDALKLAPGNVEAYRQLATLQIDRQLGHRGKGTSHATALRHAKAALRLAPQLASSYDTMALVLMSRNDTDAGSDGSGMRNLTSLAPRQRARLLSLVRASISLRAPSMPPRERSGDGDDESRAAALAHYRLFRLLASHPDLEQDAESDLPYISEAVAAIRTAARLDPQQYSTIAERFAGFEEAKRLHKEADRRGRLEREAMVEAMRAPFEQKRLEAEEDAEIEAERLRDLERGSAAKQLKKELR